MNQPARTSATNRAQTGKPAEGSPTERKSSLRETKPRKWDRFSPRKVQVRGKTYWQVSLGSEIRQNSDGQRVRIRLRRTFRDAEEARGFAELKRFERKNRGTLGVSMDEKLRGEALEAQKLLAPFGLGVLDVVREYVKRLEAVQASQTVAKALSALLAAKTHDNLRPRYLKELRVRLSRFSASFAERKLADIRSEEIDAWLRGLGVAPLTRNTFRLRLSVLFEFAREQGWVTRNPVEEVRKIKVTESLPAILKAEQAARLLEASSHASLPFWSIGIFAGLRSAELTRLKWENVHFDEGLIEVPSLSSKTASRRFVRIQPNLALWLEPYRTHHGPICPTNLRKRLEADRAAAGITKWPANALRHSFACYHLAAFRDAKDLALEMGHSRSDTLFRFYHQRVRPAEAEKFWRIVPEISASLPQLAAV